MGHYKKIYDDRHADQYDEEPERESRRSKFQNRHRIALDVSAEPVDMTQGPERGGSLDEDIWEQLGKVLPGLQVSPAVHFKQSSSNIPMPNIPMPNIPMPNILKQPVDQHVSTDYTLRVRGGDPNDPDTKRRPTDAQALSRSILHVLASNPHGYVNVKSVGIPAMAIAMTAYRLAKAEVVRRTSGSTLVVSQTEYDAEIAGKTARGICTRIFGIPIRDAV